LFITDIELAASMRALAAYNSELYAAVSGRIKLLGLLVRHPVFNPFEQASRNQAEFERYQETMVIPPPAVGFQQLDPIPDAPSSAARLGAFLDACREQRPDMPGWEIATALEVEGWRFQPPSEDEVVDPAPAASTSRQSASTDSQNVEEGRLMWPSGENMVVNGLPPLGFGAMLAHARLLCDAAVITGDDLQNPQYLEYVNSFATHVEAVNWGFGRPEATLESAQQMLDDSQHLTGIVLNYYGQEVVDALRRLLSESECIGVYLGAAERLSRGETLRGVSLDSVVEEETAEGDLEDIPEADTTGNTEMDESSPQGP
jgi:hypothetical protein